MSTAAHRALRGWTCKDVAQWLKQNNLKCSADKLMSKQIDGDALNNLTELDARRMGVPNKEISTLMEKRADLLKTDPNLVKNLSQQLKNKQGKPPLEPPTDYHGGNSQQPYDGEEDVYSWGSDFEGDDEDQDMPPSPAKFDQNSHREPAAHVQTYEGSDSDADDYLEPQGSAGPTPSYKQRTVPLPPSTAPILPHRVDKPPTTGGGRPAPAEPTLPPRGARANNSPAKQLPTPAGPPLPQTRGGQTRGLPPTPELPPTPGEPDQEMYEPFDDGPPPSRGVPSVPEEQYEITDSQDSDMYEDPDAQRLQHNQRMPAPGGRRASADSRPPITQPPNNQWMPAPYPGGRRASADSRTPMPQPPNNLRMPAPYPGGRRTSVDSRPPMPQPPNMQAPYPGGRRTSVDSRPPMLQPPNNQQMPAPYPGGRRTSLDSRPPMPQPPNDDDIYEDPDKEDTSRGKKPPPSWQTRAVAPPQAAAAAARKAAVNRPPALAPEPQGGELYEDPDGAQQNNEDVYEDPDAEADKVRAQRAQRGAPQRAAPGGDRKLPPTPSSVVNQPLPPPPAPFLGQRPPRNMAVPPPPRSESFSDEGFEPVDDDEDQDYLTPTDDTNSSAPTITPRQRHAKPAKESKQRLVDTVAVRDIKSRLRPAIQTNIKTEKPKPEPPQPEVNGNEPQGVRAMMAKFSTMASTPAPGPKSPPPSVIPPKPPGGVTMPRGAVENSYDETRGFGNHGNTQHRVLPPPPTPKRLDSDSGSGTGSPFDSGNGTICPAPPPLNTMPDVAGRNVSRQGVPLPPVPPAVEGETLQSCPWFYDDIDRRQSEAMMRQGGKEGTYMVRRSVKGGDHNPYTLALLYNNKMWNLHIRRRYDQKYALGNAKDNEKAFATVQELIAYHQKQDIVLVGSNGGQIALKHPAKRIR